MHKTTVISLLMSIAVFCIIGLNGCKSENIQVIHNDTVVTNNVSLKAFNDEVYVWESWTISTNKVDSLEQ